MAETPEKEVLHGALNVPQQSKFYGEGILWSRKIKGGREQRDSRGQGHGHKEDEEKFFAPRSLQDEREQAARTLRTRLSQSFLSSVCHDPNVSPSLCRALAGPCSATKDTINTLNSLTLSAVAGRRSRSPWVYDNRLVIPYLYTWCSCDKSHTPPRTLGGEPSNVCKRSNPRCIEPSKPLYIHLMKRSPMLPTRKPVLALFARSLERDQASSTTTPSLGVQSLQDTGI